MADRHHRAPTAEGNLYLCAVKDACTNLIAGYSSGARMTSELAVNAPRNAVALRRPAGTVVHLDRGSQFRSHAYVEALRGAGLKGSMGRVGACADNAVMECFFSRLQKRVLNHQRRWHARDELAWPSRPDTTYVDESTKVWAVPGGLLLPEASAQWTGSLSG